ncbi:hypothetical protein [Nocardioides limicola]|uniref:hypothetical protein n=1 Tax=Nocardioides limicola TaxID=2803368 RepID=UPI00193C189D|nr:hypothetical protein [Nocardioides sp. DJM-14]
MNTEEQLAQALARRGDAHNPAALTLNDVRHRAQRIRRRRATTTAMAVGVVALLVPLAWWAGPDPEPIPPVDETPALPHPVGAEPAVNWLSGGSYHSVDGYIAAIPTDHGVQSVIPFRDGHLVTDERFFEGTGGLSLVIDGSRLPSWPPYEFAVAGDPIRTPDGDRIAWIEVDPPEADTTPSPTRITVSPTYDLDPQSQEVAEAGVTGWIAGYVDDTRLVYALSFGTGGVWVTDLVNDPVRIGELTGVTAVDPTHQRLIGRLGDTDGVFTLDGERLWAADEGTLRSFSPDGGWVLGVDADGTPTVYEAATGGVVPTPAAWPSLSIWPETYGQAWESDHVLLVVDGSADTGWSVLRLGLDGTVEYAATPVQGERPPFRLFDAAPRVDEQQPPALADLRSRINELSRGDSPQVPVMVMRTARFPDGREVRLETRGWPHQFMYFPDADRFVVATIAESKYLVEVFDGPERTPSVYLANSGIVVDAAGTTVAWLEGGYTPTVLHQDAAEPARLEPYRDVAGEGRLAAVAGDCSNAAASGDCQVMINFPSPDMHISLRDGGHGSQNELLGNVSALSTTGDILGRNRHQADCWAVVDAGSGAPRWSTCASRLDSFAPDGGLVLARPLRSDDLSDHEVGILDAATGEAVGTWAGTADDPWQIGLAVWEDLDSALLQVRAEGAWWVLRISADRSTEIAAGPIAGSDAEPAMVLVPMLAP